MFTYILSDSSFILLVEKKRNIITYFIFYHRQDKAKCLTETIGDNMLTGLTKDPNLYPVSRQCKEWLQDDFNTDAPYREV